MIELIVSDLDGTLLSGPDTIHPDNVLALREAMRRGVFFAVASGRSATSCARLLVAHRLTDAHIIAVNGCQVLLMPSGEALAKRHMDRHAAREVMGVIAAHGLEGCLYTEDAIVYTSRRVLRDEMTDSDLSSPCPAKLPRVRVLAGAQAIQSALETVPMKAYCVLHPGEEAAFEKAKAACAAIPGVTITSSWPNNFEVMPKGVDKAAGVRLLASRLGVAREAVLALGDCDNDLTMLRWAGVGIAMANAQPKVRLEIARHTGQCDKGGVAQAIWRYVLAE